MIIPFFIFEYNLRAFQKLIYYLLTQLLETKWLTHSDPRAPLAPYTSTRFILLQLMLIRELIKSGGDKRANKNDWQKSNLKR